MEDKHIMVPFSVKTAVLKSEQVYSFDTNSNWKYCGVYLQ